MTFARIPHVRNVILLVVVIILILYLNTSRKIKSFDTLEQEENNWNKEQNKSYYSDGKWQYVSGDNEPKFLVFSAYLDDRLDTKYVRIIAAGKTRRPQNVWCKLYWNVNEFGLEQFEIVEGVHKVISENWSLEYSARYVLCPMKDSKPTPDVVSVLSKENAYAKNYLRINVNNERPTNWDVFNLSTAVNKIGVCVKPFYNEYNMELEIMEFIELYRILGANHFFFYNHTLGPQVSCLMRDYSEQGIVTIIDWELPIISQKEIRTEGIFAALNDCLYRTMYDYSHVLFVDVDEFIMPNKTSSYKEMIEYLSTDPDIQKKGAFLIQNAFFYRQWPDDDSIKAFDDQLAYYLTTLKKTRRRVKLNPPKIRSKYIGRPEMISMVGNHVIWEYLDKKIGTLNVKPEDSIMHHYRVCEFGGNDCVEQDSTIDRSVYRFKDTLLKTIRSEYSRLNEQCKLMELLK